jgi:hypothetical protein
LANNSKLPVAFSGNAIDVNISGLIHINRKVNPLRNLETPKGCRVCCCDGS